MSDRFTQRIIDLTPDQALEACEALATLLESELPGDVDTADFKSLVQNNQAVVGKLYDGLQDERVSTQMAGDGARSLLLLVADLGFLTQVEQALEAATVHQRDFGLLSGALILAGLAAVIGYIPKEQRTKQSKVRRIAPDGTVTETEVMENEVIRVGADAVEKLASWWKTLLTSAS
jgi:hypothetical protein